MQRIAGPQRNRHGVWVSYSGCDSLACNRFKPERSVSAPPMRPMVIDVYIELEGEPLGFCTERCAIDELFRRCRFAFDLPTCGVIWYGDPGIAECDCPDYGHEPDDGEPYRRAHYVASYEPIMLED